MGASGWRGRAISLAEAGSISHGAEFKRKLGYPNQNKPMQVRLA